MSNKKTYIEINGKRYDAHSGQPVDVALPIHSSLDGVALRPDATTAPAHKSVERSKPKHVVAHPQKSKTLMRPAVRKPELKSHHIEHAKQVEKPKVLVDHSAREARAKAIAKSNLISRFHWGPSQQTTTHPGATTPTPQAHAPHHPEPDHSTTLTAIEQRLERAVKDASSHMQQLPKAKKRLRHIHIAPSALAVLLLVGFFAYQNMPNFQMRLAANRAGFAAQMPGYRPAGFAIKGPIVSEPGKVTLNFTSRTDDRSFVLKQQASEWNSAALLNNYLGNTKPDLRTYETSGKTIYVYGDSNATWVDSGVWYEVAGDARLSEDQLQRLANSL